MIPTLLWRCPLCETNDALIHSQRRLRADLVCCRACRAEWRVRRVVGDNFYLKLSKGPDGDPPNRKDERSITAWYDAIKAKLRLEPIQAFGITLQPGERLYLASGLAALIAESTDPLFFPANATSVYTRLNKRDISGKMVGQGQLFLTDQRLIWLNEAGQTTSWPLVCLNSAYAFLNFGVMFMIEMRLYTVHFPTESLLKWVTYVALVAQKVEAETGHRITTSNF
jgi:hypothetical protein